MSLANGPDGLPNPAALPPTDAFTEILAAGQSTLDLGEERIEWLNEFFAGLGGMSVADAKAYLAESKEWLVITEAGYGPESRGMSDDDVGDLKARMLSLAGLHSFLTVRGANGYQADAELIGAIRDTARLAGSIGVFAAVTGHPSFRVRYESDEA